MNKQGKDKIGWTDYTLSVVTGCRHGCQYGPRKKCYAHLIADRIYKEGFEPTFRPERLNDKDLGRVPDGSKIFLCDMGDLFGYWVPDKWIRAHIDLAYRYPRYTFQFLTKNPSRYYLWPFPNNCWLGTTWDGLPFTRNNVELLKKNAKPENIRFVSFEPLLAPFDGSLEGIDWVIIGELTGRGMVNVEPQEVRWAQDIIGQAEEFGIPVFVKNKLGTIFPQREFPGSFRR